MTCPNPKCKATIRFAAPKSRQPALAPAAAAPAPSALKAEGSAGGSKGSAGRGAARTAKTVAGHEVQRELARGGLGIVYLAFHPHLDDFRAIKRPLPEGTADTTALLARFRREVQALAGLRSDHVVAAYDAGEDGEGPYLVMEYLDGEPLSNLIVRHRQLPLPEASELIRQAALGLQAAHEHGLVHRDLKPANLMLARTRAGAARIVVIDWGLVKRTADKDAADKRLTHIGMEMGTADFVSPEQVRDPHAVDIRADIYSLGVTYYYLLTGQVPFPGRSDSDKLRAQANEEFPSLCQVRPDVPKNVAEVLRKMVNKNPAERFQTPQEVADALTPFCSHASHRLLALLAPAAASKAVPSDTKELLDQPTIIAPQPGPARRGFPAAPVDPNRTKPIAKVWMLAGAAGLLLVLVTVGVWMLNRDSHGKNKEENGKSSEKKKEKGSAGSENGGNAGSEIPLPPAGPVLMKEKIGTVVKLQGDPGVPVTTITFTADGKRAISRRQSVYYPWEVEDRIQKPIYWYTGNGVGFGVLALSPDGERIAGSAGDTIHLWDAKTYKAKIPPVSLVGECTAAVFSPDSKMLATAETVPGDKGRIRFWNWKGNEQVKDPVLLEAPVLSLSFSMDGRHLVTSNGGLANMQIVNRGDKKIYVYRLDDTRTVEQVQQIEGHPKVVSMAAFFADGKSIFSVSPFDGTLRVWNRADGQQVREIQAGASATKLTTLTEAKEPEFMFAAAFWPWGRALTSHLDGSVKLWDMDTGEMVRFENGDPARFAPPSSAGHVFATALAFSPDGHYALAAFTDGNVYLYHLPPP